MRRRLNAVFGVVVAAFVTLDAFVVAALWPQVRTSEALSTRYAANSLLIARMGGALHTIRSSATQHHVQLRGDRPDDDGAFASQVTAAREDFERAAAEYERVPKEPAELEAWHALSNDALPRFLRAVDEVVAPPPDRAGVNQPSLTSLGVRTVHVASILERLARINAEALQRTGMRIHGVVVELVVIALSIGAVAVGAMVLLARWALSAVREYERGTAERLSELDQFAGRVAHDLRNPLHAMGMSLALLEKRAEDERTRRTVARAQDGVRRMTSFIQELLEFARSGANPDPGATASVREALRAVAQDLSPVAAEKQVDVAVDAPEGVYAAISPAALRAIVGNLADNAVKHMAPERPVRQVELRARQGHDGITIDVTDTGPGISRDALPRLFEPFFRATTSPGGFGIGLKTVKRLVDSHGGRITVESEHGEGTSFTVVLPAARAPSSAEGAMRRSDPAQRPMGTP